MEIKAVNQDKEKIERKRKVIELARQVMATYDVTLRKLAK